MIGNKQNPDNVTITPQCTYYNLKNKEIMKTKLSLLKHLTFNEIASFNKEPSENLLSNVVKRHYNKKVIDVERLDNENYLFKFVDGSYVELLLRRTNF